MTGLLVVFVLLAIGFGAGYGTRELISRKRHAEYLKYEPYVSPSRRLRQPPAFLVQPVQEKQTDDKLPRTSLHVVHPDPRAPDIRSPVQPASIEASLEELLARLQPRRQS